MTSYIFIQDEIRRNDAFWLHDCHICGRLDRDVGRRSDSWHVQGYNGVADNAGEIKKINLNRWVIMWHPNIYIVKNIICFLWCAFADISTCHILHLVKSPTQRRWFCWRAALCEPGPQEFLCHHHEGQGAGPEPQLQNGPAAQGRGKRALPHLRKVLHRKLKSNSNWPSFIY